MDALKEKIRSLLLAAGADAVGFARAEAVAPEALAEFDAWLAAGKAGELDYMHSHRDLRADPRLLLEGCRTVISTAWLYNPPRLRRPELPYLARYAYCRDYHNALRSALKPVCRQIEAETGARWRICIDSAPVMERYWAVKSGVGFCGRSGLLIVPGMGTRVFLAEILLDIDLEPDAPCRESCGECGACVSACPAGALEGRSPDCRRCLSALTIEKPGTAPAVPRLTLLGCDRCQDVCPYNRPEKTAHLPQLQPLEKLEQVTAGELTQITEQEFRQKYAGTPLLRPGLTGLRANLALPSTTG